MPHDTLHTMICVVITLLGVAVFVLYQVAKEINEELKATNHKCDELKSTIVNLSIQRDELMAHNKKLTMAQINANRMEATIRDLYEIITVEMDTIEFEDE